MADDKSGYQHSASDRKLDASVEAEIDADHSHESSHAKGPSHDPAEIRKHDDDGKDRLFEGREQHDEGEKNSEKTRLARDVQKHHHGVDDDVADAGSGPSAKRKS